MKNLLFTVLAILIAGIGISAQNTNSTAVAKNTTSNTANSNSSETKRAPVFRATKDQVTQAQTILKQKGLYTGEATGKLDDAARDALKKFQDTEKIRATGTLNRITLEKLGIALTDKQKLIPVSDSSITPVSASASGKSRNPVFRASKDQIMQAQKMLKGKNMYSGAEDGKINDDFRISLKKYQETEKIKVTGTLNRETLEKMAIPLTDNQKAMQTGSASNK